MMRVQRTEQRSFERRQRIRRPSIEVQLPGPDQRTRKLLALDEQPRIQIAPVVIQPTRNLAARMMEVLHTILELKKMGANPALVFDIDNTLLDTRFRTLNAAHAFKLGDSQPLLHTTLADVGYLPRQTVLNAKVHDEETQTAFETFFEDFFWRESSFRSDQPIDLTIGLAKLAKKLGADVYFLTGRTETFRDVTKEMLESHGLEVPDKEHLIMKSPKRDREGNLAKTEPYKAWALRRLHKQKITVAAYVTEGARDMRYLQDRVRSVMSYLYLLFPIDEPGYTVRRNKKTVFVPMELELPTEARVRAAYELRS